MKELVANFASKKLAGLGAVLYAILSLPIATLPQNQQGIAVGCQAVALAIAGGAYFVAQGGVDKAEALSTDTTTEPKPAPTIPPKASQ